MTSIKPLSTATMLNRANTTRKSDEFYVTFLRYPDNVSNYLAKQLVTIARPSIMFETTEVNHRGAKYNSTAQVRFEPVTIMFKDDSEGLTSRLLQTQVYRQLKKVDMSDEEGYDSEYMFDVRVDRYNTKREITDSYALINCFISALDYSEMEVGDDSEATITATLTFENMDCFIIDEYLRMN